MNTDSTACRPASSCAPSSTPDPIRKPFHAASRAARILVREQVDERALHAGVQRLPEADDGHAVLAEQAVGVLAEPANGAGRSSPVLRPNGIGAQLEAARIGRDVLAGDSGTARRRSEPAGPRCGRGRGAGACAAAASGRRDETPPVMRIDGISAKTLDHLKPPEARSLAEFLTLQYPQAYKRKYRLLKMMLATPCGVSRFGGGAVRAGPGHQPDGRRRRCAGPSSR